jgi:hypothetical protein
MKLWRVLNSPLIVTLLAIAIVFAVPWYGANTIYRRFFDEHEAQRIECLARLQLLSFSEVQTPAGNAQRFVGRVRNNSDCLVVGITGAVSFYDDSQNLKDFFTAELDGVFLLKPKTEAEFFFIRPDRDRTTVKTTTPRSELRFVNVKISKEAP